VVQAQGACLQKNLKRQLKKTTELCGLLASYRDSHETYSAVNPMWWGLRVCVFEKNLKRQLKKNGRTVVVFLPANGTVMH
jgi:hypothetical protein